MRQTMQQTMQQEEEKITQTINMLSGMLDVVDKTERMHLTFRETDYDDAYCEDMCPAKCDTCWYLCKSCEYRNRKAQKQIAAANILVEGLLKNGSLNLGLCTDKADTARTDDATNEIATNETRYVTFDECEFCDRCGKMGSGDCPEDVFSGKCPHHQSALTAKTVVSVVDDLICSIV